jgi:hypothetical protein
MDTHAAWRVRGYPIDNCGYHSQEQRLAGDV